MLFKLFQSHLGKIDNIDDKILELFIERMKLATDVAKYKAANNMTFEEAIIDILKKCIEKDEEK